MSILNKFNKGKVFEYNTEIERTYVNLEQLFKKHGMEHIYSVQALFINTKSRFGDSPVIVSDNYLVNCPQHLTETVRDMIKEDEIVDMVNDDRVGFTIYSYKGKNGSGYSINWIEL